MIVSYTFDAIMTSLYRQNDVVLTLWWPHYDLTTLLQMDNGILQWSFHSYLHTSSQLSSVILSSGILSWTATSIRVSMGASISTQIARFMGPTWDPYGADRTQVGPILAPWTLLFGYFKSEPVWKCLIFVEIQDSLHINYLIIYNTSWNMWNTSFSWKQFCSDV